MWDSFFGFLASLNPFTHIIKLKHEWQSIQPPLLPYHHHHCKRTDTIMHHNERLCPKATGYSKITHSRMSYHGVPMEISLS
ncbi:hypothetical protein SCLCIDRAFT_1224229 [Scleroderma citrinum Foug A]|uniref:Uncharacterized protein n=1 Tax=Scleroderma citrinum Foug A TaxID=1036808 RepID=A0A0C2ZFR8_9AGAM|nr:hypothetical protein SCLCIDRAFT_1224229 [Scleroderma citrinum Foug A]